MKTKKNTFIKVNTWLPIFSGFYGSHFEFDYYQLTDCLYEDETAINTDLKDFINDIISDHIDNSQYENDVSKHCTDFISSYCQEHFPDIIESVEYESLYSPKEYNFSNDSINCIMSVNFNKLLKTFSKQENAARFLKDNYTSRDGFISHYSNKLTDWVKNAFTDQVHSVGKMLEFLLLENDDQIYYDMLCYVQENVYSAEYVEYDKLINAINEHFTFDNPLKDFSQEGLENFSAYIGGNSFMQNITGIGLFTSAPENIPEYDYFADKACNLLDTFEGCNTLHKPFSRE